MTNTKISGITPLYLLGLHKAHIPPCKCSEVKSSEVKEA